VPEEPFAVTPGQARVLTEGKDVTIVAISHMVVEALRA
jgi:pyruvate/2-oxoglutarate/acetoin dehydrogenase E1 component